MSDSFTVSLSLKNDKLLFKGSARDNDYVSMDYFPPLGDGKGYTGLELLLMSFSGCSATSIVFLLRKMGKTILGLDVESEGVKSDVLPNAFKEIVIAYKIKSKDVVGDDVIKALKLSEESVCPVWAMIKGNVKVSPSFEIIA
ncbi:MAG: OsmC family protein [Bacteroidetes bacterium]|nr:OsmC family protein [Bacteroidota bacterium]